MKTILVPTDFSEEAANAIRYAGALAARNKSRVVLAHAIPVEFLTTQEGSEVALPPAPQQQAYYLNKLTEFGKNILQDNGPDVEMEAVCKTGSLPDNLGKLVRSQQAGLVVMGTHGAHHLPETLLGTHTYHFIRHAECPVLMIPGKAAFREIKKIAYASDFEVEDESPYLQQLLVFAEPFSPQLYIVNIRSEEQLSVVPDQKVLDNIQARFPDKFCIAQIREDDVVAALRNFVEDNQIDVLVISIQKRILLERLFHRSISKELAFHYDGPLLALPPNPAQPGPP